MSGQKSKAGDVSLGEEFPVDFPSHAWLLASCVASPLSSNMAPGVVTCGSSLRHRQGIILDSIRALGKSPVFAACAGPSCCFGGTCHAPEPEGELGVTIFLA